MCNRKTRQGPTGAGRASGPTSIYLSPSVGSKKDDLSYVQDGQTGRFGTLPVLKQLKKYGIIQPKIPSYFLCFNPIQHIRSLIENRISENCSDHDPTKGPENSINKFPFTTVVQAEKNSCSLTSYVSTITLISSSGLEKPSISFFLSPQTSKQHTFLPILLPLVVYVFGPYSTSHIYHGISCYQLNMMLLKGIIIGQHISGRIYTWFWKKEKSSDIFTTLFTECF